MIFRVPMEAAEGLLALTRHIRQDELFLTTLKPAGHPARILRGTTTNNQLYGILERKSLCSKLGWIYEFLYI